MGATSDVTGGAATHIVGSPTGKARRYAVPYVSDHLLDIPPQLKLSIVISIQLKKPSAEKNLAPNVGNFNSN